MRQAAYARLKLAGAAALALVPLAAAHFLLGDKGLKGWLLLFAAPTGLVHTITYATLLWVFARSLRSGGEPIVARVARRMRGDLPQQIESYTRRVTLAWAIFFAAQLAASAFLLAARPLPVWLAFINLWNLPLLLVMGGAEYSYRLIRFRHMHHGSIVDMVRAFRAERGTLRAGPERSP